MFSFCFSHLPAGSAHVNSKDNLSFLRYELSRREKILDANYTKICPRKGIVRTESTEYLSDMNRIHRWFCRTNRWRNRLHNELMPWALSDAGLSGEILEIGPGPGLSTEVLCRRFSQITSVEIDERLAASLARRSATIGSNLRIVRGDGTSLPFRDAHFSGAVCFTMLHHIPGAELQNRLFREVRRVLKPGAVFLATDSLPSFTMRLIHIHDTMVLIDPSTIQSRLETAGFSEVAVEVAHGGLRFQARRGWAS